MFLAACDGGELPHVLSPPSDRPSTHPAGSSPSALRITEEVRLARSLFVKIHTNQGSGGAVDDPPGHLLMARTSASAFATRTR
jgi:hypothetical protein